MNVSQLQPPTDSQPQRVSKEAAEIDADFLALRLLNKRSRVRLSPEPFDLDAIPSQGRLFAVANTKGWFAAAVREASGYSVVCSPLAQLRATFSASSDGELSFQARCKNALPGIPTTLVFADNDRRLVIGFAQGSIMVYDTEDAFASKAESLSSCQSITGPPGTLRDICPNPGDTPELVAILRQVTPDSDSLAVEIRDVSRLQSIGGWRRGDAPNTTPTTVSWSAKGKQLAIGLLSGDIITFSPSDTSVTKVTIPRPSSSDSLQLLSLTWLSNNEFHTIYGPRDSSAPDVEQTHLILVFDSKANTIQEIKLITPYLPFPGIRPPGAFTAVLRNWERARFLLFIGDSTSSDIGLIGSKTDISSPPETWCNFSLEETSTPSVPLDKDMNDTVPLGLAQDFTATEPLQHTGASGETTEVPPSPVMFLYASDGTVIAWNIINISGAAYPDMNPISATVDSGVAHPSAFPQLIEPEVISRSASVPMTDDNMAENAVTPVRTPDLQSSIPATSTPVRLLSAGHPSSFEQVRIDVDASVARSSSPPLPSPIASDGIMTSDSDTDSDVDVDVDVDVNVDADDDAYFGELSLGQDASTTARANAPSGGLFGSSTASFSIPSTTSASAGTAFGPTSAFGSGPVQPASGFGTFGNIGTSTFAKPATSTASGFDSSSWASGIADAKTSTSAFGKSSFGQPAFGQSAFGQSSFSQSSSEQPSAVQSAFGQVSAKPTEPKVTSAFDQFVSQPSAFGQYASKPSVFGQSATQSSAFGQTTTPTSVFGGSRSGESVFGKSSLAQSTTTTPLAEATPTPVQKKPTTPNQTSTGTPSDVSTSNVGITSGGFGAFASQPSTFGQAVAPAFGNIVAKPSAFGTPSFGQPAFGKSSFGQAATDASSSNAASIPGSGQTTPAKSTFGQSGFEQPANIPKTDTSSTTSGGFAAFAPRPSAFDTSSPSPSVFGKSSFGQAASNVSATDTTAASVPAPGETTANAVFGQSSFGPASTVPKAATSNGGFGAFAASPVTFGSLAGTTNGKPAWSTSNTVKTESEKSSSSVFTPVKSEEKPIKLESAAVATTPPDRDVTQLAPSASPPDETRNDVKTPPSFVRANVPQVNDAIKPAPPALSAVPANSDTAKPVPSKTPPPLPTLEPAAPPVAAPFSLTSYTRTPSTISDGPSSKKTPEKTPFTTTATTIPGLSTRPLVPSPLSNFSVPSSSFFGVPKAQTPIPITPPVKVGVSESPSLQSFQRMPEPFLSVNSLTLAPSPSKQPTAVKPEVPSRAVEDGMQAECARLYTTLTTDLEQLRRLAEAARAKRKACYETPGSPHNDDDLRQTANWLIPDVKQFDAIVQSLERRVSLIREQTLTHVVSIRDLESSLLKASTRKEEIARFGAASKDTELSKVLEARSLGPDHREAQSQLRRDIRIIRERLQQLEDHIQASKKKVSQMQNGRSSFRPPSLDTINRTYRNIEIAIEQHESTVSQLAAEVAKINLGAGPKGPPRDKRLPEQYSRPTVYPTPHVAISTAAALNAEMSAQKLKHALLTGRKEPFLNTQAIVPPSTDSAVLSVEPKPLWFASLSTEPGTQKLDMPSWAPIPEPDPSPGSSRQRASGSKQHAKPIPLKKSTQTVTTTAPPAGFSWGPLPGIAPMVTLSADLRTSGSSQPATPPRTSSPSTSFVKS